MRTLTLLTSLALSTLASAQEGRTPGFPGTPLSRPRVEIPFNRLYDDAEVYALLDRLAAEWPALLSHEVIGQSHQGREMRVYTLNDPASGAADAKPAMWIDSNVHGNEIQGTEACIYLVWYLLENRGVNERVDDLFANYALYVLPMVNPDGRHSWIHDPHNSSSSRTGVKPDDDDRDGLYDEDPPNDLNGDGHLTSIRKYVPGEGDYRLDPDDPRIMERVPRDERGLKGDWVLLGREGLDDDGDGRVNEDGVGGYDMNRAWPSLWRPEHVQYGAGAYPLFWPETRCIAEFLLAHPNVAAVQSFHNAGGMILRGPGAEIFGTYPSADVRVYDALGKDGERMLPFYRYMILWKDLYTTFGGFVTWTYEGLGIISFTNELWTRGRQFPDDSNGRSEDLGRNWFDDELMSGSGFVEWEPFDHPVYGAVEIGGFKKDVGRVPPSFLIEEMCHRNAMFCLKHAESMPVVAIDEPVVTDLGNGLKSVEVIVRNERLIPTRSARAAEKHIGQPDVLTLAGAGLEVLAGGYPRDRWRPTELDFVERDPGRLVREQGLGSLEELRVRWLVRGSGPATVGWSGEKARDVTRGFRL